MYSGEYDACDVTLSVYPHRASLKNMPDHGGLSSLPGVDIHSESKTVKPTVTKHQVFDWGRSKDFQRSDKLDFGWEYIILKFAFQAAKNILCTYQCYAPRGGGRAYPRDLHGISCSKWGYLPFFRARGLGHFDKS